MPFYRAEFFFLGEYGGDEKALKGRKLFALQSKCAVQLYWANGHILEDNWSKLRIRYIS